MTAPTSKSKTKNYRLLTARALRPHMSAAAYFLRFAALPSTFVARPTYVGAAPSRLRVYNS